MAEFMLKLILIYIAHAVGKHGFFFFFGGQGERQREGITNGMHFTA